MSDFVNITNYTTEMLEKKGCVYSFVNPYSYDVLIKNKSVDFSRITFFSDGILFVKMSNAFRGTKLKRFSFDFTSLANEVFEHASINKLKVAIIGGDELENKLAVSVLKKRFSNLDIAYRNHGYIKGDFDVVIKEMNDLGVEVVIAGLGTPLQEKFLLECSDTMDKLKYGFSCGGFLTQISQNENYFNPLLSRFHLRWLQRFIRHDYVRKRVFFDYPKFIVGFIFGGRK